MWAMSQVTYTRQAAIRVSRRVIAANSQPWQDGSPAQMRPWPHTPNGLDAGKAAGAAER
jgi:hypothetical protein